MKMLVIMKDRVHPGFFLKDSEGGTSRHWERREAIPH
jgi:hypothetical protein